MNPEVQKLEGLLARIAKNRAIPRVKPPVGPVQSAAPHQRTVTQDLVPVAHAPKPAPITSPAPAPVAPVVAKAETPTPALKAQTPMPAPAAPVVAKTETPTPAVKAPTPMPAPVAPKPPMDAQPTSANVQVPAIAKKPEAKTIELEIDDLPEDATRDSEPEIELVPLSAKADRPTPEPLSPFDEPDEPEIEEVASSDEPVVVLDDEPEDAEIIEPPKASQTPIAAKESVSDIEITIEPATPAPSTRPAPAPIPEPSTVASFDEASFADVDMDEPAPAAPPPKAETVTPLEAAVRSAQPTPSAAVIEAAGVVEKPKDVVRVVAPAKPVASSTFGALMKRSLGLRLR